MEAAPQWELNKENIKPLKQGRNIASLHNVLRLQNSTADRPRDDSPKRAENSIEHECKKYENAIAAEDNDDPLATWTEYLQWFQQNHPSSNSKAIDLIERCTRAFKDDGRYKSDIRYVRIWIAYVDAVDDPKDIFAFMEANDIGLQHALFYEMRAVTLEAAGDMPAADNVYRAGVGRRAEPLDRLKRRFEGFKGRLAAWRAGAGAEATHGHTRETLNEAQRNVLGTMEDGAPRSASRAPTPAADSAQGFKLAQAPSSGFSVFNDRQGGARPVVKRAAWTRLATQKEVNKENEGTAGRWNTYKVDQHGVADSTDAGGAGAGPTFEAFQDTILSSVRTGGVGQSKALWKNKLKSESLRKNPLRNFLAEPTSSKGSGEAKEKVVPVAYNKHEVYPSTDEEFSFEELRARVYARKAKEKAAVTTTTTTTTPPDTYEAMDEDPVDAHRFGLAPNEEKSAVQPPGRGLHEHVVGGYAGDAEPTVTINTKLAMNDIMAMFNKPLAFEGTAEDQNEDGDDEAMGRSDGGGSGGLCSAAQPEEDGGFVIYSDFGGDAAPEPASQGAAEPFAVYSELDDHAAPDAQASTEHSARAAMGFTVFQDNDDDAGGAGNEAPPFKQDPAAFEFDIYEDTEGLGTSAPPAELLLGGNGECAPGCVVTTTAAAAENDGLGVHASDAAKENCAPLGTSPPPPPQQRKPEGWRMALGELGDFATSGDAEDALVAEKHLSGNANVAFLAQFRERLEEVDGVHFAAPSASGPTPERLTALREDDMFELCFHSYRMIRVLSNADPSPVFLLSKDTNTEEEITLKICREEDIEEFILARRLAALGQAEAAHSAGDEEDDNVARMVADVEQLFVYADRVYSTTKYYGQDTLADAMAVGIDPAARKMMDELLVMFYAVNVIKTVSLLHRHGVVHGNMSPAVFYLRNSNQDSWSFRPKNAGLLVFGLGAPGRTRTARSDWFAAAEIVHCMLFGHALETTTAADGTATLKRAFRPFWRTNTWQAVFDKLLNPPASIEDNLLESHVELQRVAMEMVPNLEHIPHSRKLGTLLRKQEIALFSNR